MRSHIWVQTKYIDAEITGGKSDNIINRILLLIPTVHSSYIYINMYKCRRNIFNYFDVKANPHQTWYFESRGCLDPSIDFPHFFFLPFFDFYNHKRSFSIFIISLFLIQCSWGLLRTSLDCQKPLMQKYQN